MYQQQHQTRLNALHHSVLTMLLLGRFTGLVLLMLLTGAVSPDCPPERNDLVFQPSAVIVKYGDNVSANCSTSSDPIKLSWTGPQGHVQEFDFYDGTQTATWEMDSLTDWDIQPECYMNLSDVQCHKVLSVILYKTPDVVSISTVNHTGPMTEGRLYELQCDIQNVAPVRFLTVNWFKGDTQVGNKSFSDLTKTPLNVSETLQISPSDADDGAQFKCEAGLDLGAEGPQPPPPVKSDSLIIRVPSSCSITLQPPKLLVKYGDLASANCSTTKTHMGMGWEASQGPVDMRDDVQLITWRVENLVEWNIRPLCFINIKIQQCKESLPVTIYKTPDLVSISTVNHTGPMTEGGLYELRCDIQNVAPVRFLTVNWFKGDTLVGKKSFTDLTKTPVNVSETLQISPSDADDGAQFRCEAKLDLGTEEPQPPPPVKLDSLIIRVHYKPVIQCAEWSPLINTSLNSYPHAVVGNPPPNIVWFQEQSQIESTKSLGKDDSGQYTFTASNSIGNSSCVTHITVEYGPIFDCPSNYEGKEHIDVSKNCTVTASPSPTVTWFKDGKNVPTPRNLTRTDTGSYQISARNKHGATNHSLNINVLYKPVIQCAEWSPLIKTSLNSYPHAVVGNPPPNIVWFQEQSQIESTKSLGKDDSGQYTFTASNSIGNSSCITHITVEYGPIFDCPSNYEGKEHIDVSKNCTVTASPSPTVTWFKDGKNVPAPRNLRRTDTGSYQISARNKHGATNHSLNINVLYKPVIQCAEWSPLIKTSLNSYPHAVVGNPPPNIVWFQEQSQIESTKSLGKDDSGQYTFTASNSIGNSSCITHITVEYGPIFDCPSNYEGKEHIDVSKNCTVTASPSPTVTWFKDRKNVPTPRNLTRTDTGSYQISARNKHGAKNHSLNINVLYGPEIEVGGDGSVEVYEGQKAVLSCSAKGNPEPTVEWSFKGLPLDTRGGHSHEIPKATSADSGRYTCNATNKIGSQTREVSLVIKDIWTIIASALAALLFIILLIIIIVCVLRKRRGKYDVQLTGKEFEMKPLQKWDKDI
ncbi:intercellular adhesion molecule 5 [Hoplias malabaricus]|uniref:intercellular adhesion molecule 5 n=1 Tax=Hoplias malabaricus TaxID=27720 RepID=UPI003461EE92